MFFDCNFTLLFLLLLHSRSGCGNGQQNAERDLLSTDADQPEVDVEYGNSRENDDQVTEDQQQQQQRQQHFSSDHSTVDQNELFHSGHKCDILELVRCFVDVLDDWAWHLWTFKDNIAAVNESVCSQHTAMDKCVNQKDCTKREILDVSVNISDILLHKTRSGTFLKGYYIAKFSCSAEGAPLVHTHRECLLKDTIGQKAAATSHSLELELRTKMGHELLQEDQSNVVPEETQDSTTYCNLLNTKCQDLYDSTAKECPAEAAYLMCRSLRDAFINIFPDILENCHIPCAERTGDTSDVHGSGGDGSADLAVGRMSPNHQQTVTEQSKRTDNQSSGTNGQQRIVCNYAAVTFLAFSLCALFIIL